MPPINELFNLAVRHFQNGEIAEAEPLFRQILQADPRHVEAHHLLGIIANQNGRPDVGIPLFRQAIALNSVIPAFHSNLGIALEMQGHLAEATACFRQALQLDPNYSNARFHLGNVFSRQGRHSEAEPCFRHVLALNPHHADAHNNLGITLQEQGRPDEAARCFRQASLINPNFADAHNNLGNILKDRCQLTEAAECYERALRIDPQNKVALWNRALLRLLHGDLDGGWPDFELRWEMPGAIPPTFEQPRWDGSPLLGKTILVYAEGGLGDTFQYLRYLPFIKERGGRVIFACQRPLVKFLQGIANVDQLIVFEPPWPDCDVQISQMSLPLLFGTNLTNIPARIPYLFADPGRVEHWREEIMRAARHKPTGDVAVGSPLNIGIAWESSPKNKEYRFRSIPLKFFEAIANIDNVRLINLQKGPGTGQLATWAGRTPIIDLGDRLDADGAFLDTAAVMMNLDLMISVDTALTHLAGALGVPVWMAMQYASDWRWLLDRNDSPWYPTLRLFRKPIGGNWEEVFARIAAEIRNL